VNQLFAIFLQHFEGVQQEIINPLVSPGDVIFVPDNPLMNIIDLIPVVNSMINLIQNAQQIIQ